MTNGILNDNDPFAAVAVSYVCACGATSAYPLAGPCQDCTSAAAVTASVATYTRAAAMRQQQERSGAVPILVGEFSYVGKVAFVTTAGKGFDVRLWVDYGKIATPIGRHYARKDTAIKFAQELLGWAYGVYAVFDPVTRQSRIYVDGVYHEAVSPRFVQDRLSYLRRFGPTIERVAA